MSYDPQTRDQMLDAQDRRECARQDERARAKAERPDTIWTRLFDVHFSGRFPTKSEREGEVSLPALENAELEANIEPCSACGSINCAGTCEEMRELEDFRLCPNCRAYVAKHGLCGACGECLPEIG